MALLHDLLAYGRLEQLVFGATQETVLAWLQEPQDVSVEKDPVIWKYGPVELVFSSRPGERHLLESMHVYFWKREPLPGPMRFADWQPDWSARPQEFHQFCLQHSIPWHPLQALTFPDSQLAFTTISQVNVIFGVTATVATLDSISASFVANPRTRSAHR